MRSLSSLLVVAMVAAACGGSDSPDEPTATVATPATTSVAGTAAPTSSTPTASPTTAEPIAPTAGVELLVAGPGGVSLVNADGLTETLVSSAAVFAIDDLDGGVLFQVERLSRDRRSMVYRVARESNEAVAILIPTLEQGLVLNGVARDGDDTIVFYTRSEGSTVDDARDTFRRYSLSTREVTEISVIGGWDSSSFPISISESLVLLNWGAESLHGMNFTDLDGNSAAVAADPDPVDEDFDSCGECPHLGELSTDGGQLVYVEESDGATYAVIRHVGSGAEIRRIDLQPDEWWVVSFDMSNDRLVVNRGSASGLLDAWVYDLGMVNPEPISVGVRGEAYLTRSSVDVNGPVTAP